MRKSRPKKRILLPDPKYKDPYVTRFVNNLMFSGKKNLAFKIFYDSLDIVGDKFKSEGKTPLEIFKQALDNVTPQVEVKGPQGWRCNFSGTNGNQDRQESSYKHEEYDLFCT